MHMAWITRWNPSPEADAGPASHEAASQPGICCAITHSVLLLAGQAGDGP